MFKTIFTVAITVFLVLFALNNFDRVTVHLLIGKSVDMRLIFVILLAALTGYLLRHFIGITREEELKRRLLIERKKRFQHKSQPNLDDELDL